MSCDSHVVTHGNLQCLNIVCPISSASEISQVELDLVPTVVQPHRHSTYERLDTCCGLIVRGPEPPPDILIIKDLRRKRKWVETAKDILITDLNEHVLTWTSKEKYFFMFLMIMTRKGSLIPRVFCGSAGHVIYVVLKEIIKKKTRNIHPT